jgi:hypothetical protein
VPPLLLETPEQERRHQEAQARRQVRLAEKAREGKPHPTDKGGCS